MFIVKQTRSTERRKSKTEGSISLLLFPQSMHRSVESSMQVASARTHVFSCANWLSIIDRHIANTLSLRVFNHSACCLCRSASGSCMFLFEFTSGKLKHAQPPSRPLPRIFCPSLSDRSLPFPLPSPPLFLSLPLSLVCFLHPPNTHTQQIKRTGTACCPLVCLRVRLEKNEA